MYIKTVYFFFFFFDLLIFGSSSMETSQTQDITNKNEKEINKLICVLSVHSNYIYIKFVDVYLHFT